MCAQWKAADSAKSAAVAAWTLGAFGLLIGGMTLFFASRAAHWAKEAAYETKRSADAANAALLSSREQLRASVHPITVAGGVMHGVARYLRISIVWKNVGQTTATDLQFNRGFEILDDDTPRAVTIFPPEKDSVVCSLAANADLRGTEARVDVRFLEDIYYERKHLFLWGYATYNDVFDKSVKRESYTCWKINFTSERTAKNLPFNLDLLKTIEFSIVGPSLVT